jgi:hypothetical protein
MSHPPPINPSRDACSISLDPGQFKDLVELMLCFHATLKYGTNIFSCGTREKIVAYQTNFHKMMLYIIDGLKRPSASNQFRLQKFLECCHFLQEHLFKGPPCAHNTDVGERGLKKWAKAPAKTAQNRGDSVFKQQVARNNHEAGLLHAVVSEFCPELLRRQKSHVTEDIVSATGTTFVCLCSGGPFLVSSNGSTHPNQTFCNAMRSYFPDPSSSGLCPSSVHFTMRDPAWKKPMRLSFQSSLSLSTARPWMAEKKI